MKKLLTIVLGAAVGYGVFLQVQKKQQTKALWHEVTDPVA